MLFYFNHSLKSNRISTIFACLVLLFFCRVLSKSVREKKTMADDDDDLSSSISSPVTLSTIEKEHEQQQQVEKNINNQVDFLKSVIVFFSP